MLLVARKPFNSHLIFFGMETTFAQRFKQACDDSPIIPEHGRGRQVSIAKRLGVTQEAVRKWFSDEAKPRPDKMRELAEYLEVEEPWLALGIKPELDRNEKRRALNKLEGAVQLVAGLILLEGGTCAWPKPNDQRAPYTDLYVIMRGSQWALHVSLAREVSDAHYEIKIPREYRDVKVVAVLQDTPGRYNFLDLPVELIEKHKQRRAGDFVIAVSKIENKYHTGATQWPRFKTFSELT